MIFSNAFPIPLYNTPHIHSLYNSLPKKNGRGLLIGIEMVLLEGSKIEILEELDGGVFRVKTPHYIVEYPVYIDARHVSGAAAPKSFILPSYNQALEKLVAIEEGTRYIYGANHSQGLPYLFDHFPPSIDLSEEEKKDWILQGLDCSGLFFEICNGATVRNCSMLPQIGETLLDPKVENLRPLDLILTPGHVVIVESSRQVIESAYRFNGVKRGPLTSEILEGCRIVRPFFKNVPVVCKLFD
ncbi:MAG: hypothetical protein ACOYK9_04715 [Chlamydiia bacterium]